MALLITLLIYAVIIAIVWWVFTQLPIPAPFRWVGAVIIALVAIVMLLRLAPVAGSLGP